MIRGATVTVRVPTSWTTDRYNNRRPDGYEPRTVENVLIVPGATADLEAERPDGVTVAFTLHFPKTFTESLEGALVDLPAPYGGTYRVIGKPAPYMAANTPTPWYMPAEVERVYG